MKMNQALISVGLAGALLSAGPASKPAMAQDGQVFGCSYSLKSRKETCTPIVPAAPSEQASKLETEVKRLEKQVIDKYFSKGDYYEENFWQEWKDYGVFNLKAGLTLFKKDGPYDFEAVFYSKGSQQNQYPFSSGTFQRKGGKLEGAIVVNKNVVWIEQNPELVMSRYKSVLSQMLEHAPTIPDVRVPIRP